MSGLSTGAAAPFLRGQRRAPALPYAGAGAKDATGTVILRPRSGAGMQDKAARQRRLAGAGEKLPLEANGECGLSHSPSEKVRGARGVVGQPGRVLSGRVATFKSRRRGRDRRPPYDRVERDYGVFRRAAARMLRVLDDGRRADAARHARYGYRPCPIFRINLTQRVPYARFKKSLGSANVETISSATGRSGYWVVAGGEGHARRLDRQIARRVALRGPTFVDAIASFGEADPSKKLGPSLVWHPIDGGFEPVDVEIWRLGDDALEAFMGPLRMMVADNGGRITDTYRTHDTFVAQIACDAALLSTVAALREVVRVDRPHWAGTGDRSRRAARKIVAGSRAAGTQGTSVAGPGTSPHPPTKPAIGGPVLATGRGCGRDSVLAPAIEPQAMCRRAPPSEPPAGARSHPVSGPRPLGTGVPRRAGDCPR